VDLRTQIPLGGPLPHCRFCFGTGPERLALGPRPRSPFAPDEAVERDEEHAHQLVVAVAFGELEEALDERLVAVAVERVGEVIEQGGSGERPRVGDPLRGERPEPVGVVDAAKFVQEPRMPAVEQFLGHRPRPGGHRTSSPE